MRKTLISLLVIAAAVSVMAACPGDGSENDCAIAANGSCLNPESKCFDRPGEDCVCRDSVAYVQCQCVNRI